MARSPWRRMLSVLLVTLLALMGVVLTVPEVRAATWTQDTDGDFNLGTFTGTEVVGTGAPAVVQLTKDATDWRNETPPSNPGAREGTALAYDSSNNVVVAFGGFDGANQGDTWEYNPQLNTWTQTSTTGPSPRAYAGLAFDSGNGTIVLFGGVSDAGFEADTWEYNAATNAWFETTPTLSPPQMASYSLAYDSTANRVILASQSLVTSLMETWAYETTADLWVNRLASFSPERASHGLVYHPVFDRTVLFGGAFFAAPYGDTWEYDYTANSWALTVADGSGPPARANMGLSYRSTDSAVWMFGGTDGTPRSDTWRYFDVTGTRLWVNRPVQRNPPARDTFGMADEAANGRSYIYGGVLGDGSRASDTWSIGPAFGGSGTWESRTFDGSGANADWNTISWLGATPAQTTLRFQTASADEPNPPTWTFIGGAACNTFNYYTTSGATTCPANDNHRYFRVRANLLTLDNLNTPTMDSVTIDYTVPPSDPFLVATLPNFPPPVPLSTPILIRFSEQMNILSVGYTISPVLTVSESWSESDSALTLSHSGLAECTAYTVTVTAGSDLDGNPLNNTLNRDNNPFSFPSVCIYPEVVATNPAQGTTDVPLNAPIVVDFSEAMNTTTVTHPIVPTISLSASWSIGDTRLTLTHTTDFEQCTMYTVTVDGKDLAGLSLIPGSVPNPWDFTTFCTIPFIRTTDPADLQTGVSPTADIIVEFSEPMQPATVLWDSQPATVFTFVWSNGNRTLTLSHAIAWSDCTMVTMEITAGKDVDGNDLGPGPVPNPWKFAVQCLSPFLVFTVPADGATGVDQFGNITIQFSEAMNTGTVAVTVNPPLTVTYTWMGLDQLLVVSHTLPFACGVNTISVSGQDPDGNFLVPGLAPNPFTLTPVCPNPFITNTNPSSDQTGVAIAASIMITFSERMNTTPGTTVWDVVPMPAGGFTESWSAGDTVLTLSHGTAFDQNTQYNVAVLDARDWDDGNPLIAGPVPNPWRFTTAGINPQILSTDPADGATDVPIGQNVVVVFSEPMDRLTVVATSSPPTFLAHGWNATNETLTLSHINPFLDCTRYQFTVTGNDLAGDPLIPGPVPNPWNFTTICFDPVITDTNPAAGAIDVPLDAPIWVNFSKAMNTATVSAVANPPVTFSYQWSNGDRTLRLTHGTFFLECTVYMITVSGQDTAGNPLGPGPVPNPWTFRTFCPAPSIVSTVPADGDIDVPTTTPVVVTFSRAMDTGTVSWQFTPSAPVADAWTGGNTILTLTPVPPFLECTNYQVLIQGRSTEGKDLVAGPVPNPWAFSTVCPVPPLAGLTITRIFPTTIHLSWNAVPAADEYRVYESQVRFAPWPWTLRATVPAPATTYDAAGDLTDGLTHYYIVRAVRATSEGANSTMAVKIQMDVGFSSTTTNVRWFSLPYRSEYTRASDIATELGPSKVNVIGKWDPATQRTILYYYFRGAWRGTDFSIASGDGLYLSSVSAFPWYIVGTDRAVTLSFTLNLPPLTNFNWIGVPYTAVYRTASDLVRDIEGNIGPGANTKIVEVAKWDAASQTLVRYFWTPGGWAGTDFTVNPGDGIYFNIVASFGWPPILVTPEVP